MSAKLDYRIVTHFETNILWPLLKSGEEYGLTRFGVARLINGVIAFSLLGAAYLAEEPELLWLVFTSFLWYLFDNWLQQLERDDYIDGQAPNEFRSYYRIRIAILCVLWALLLAALFFASFTVGEALCKIVAIHSMSLMLYVLSCDPLPPHYEVDLSRRL